MTRSAPVVANHWPETSCARAFWGQQELPPYRKLLADTTAWLDPGPGERWLDLGCGGGRLTAALWEKSRGGLGEIVALDCAAANEARIDALAARMGAEERVRFVCGNFSDGLASWDDDSFDGAVSGLAIQYAESFCPEKQCWTTDAYDQLLVEVHRILRPGGRFVFSVNVPRASWGLVALDSILGFFVSRNPVLYVWNAMQMWQYGRWLRKEADRGRFHYLPIERVIGKLEAAGFEDVEHRLTFTRQAYLVRCRKP